MNGSPWLFGWKDIEKYTGFKKRGLIKLAKQRIKNSKIPIKRSPGGRPMVSKKELDLWFSEQKYFFKFKIPRGSSSYSGKKYMLRFRILERDGFRCQYCGRSPKDDNSVVLHIDHIFPVSKGGTDKESNLITSCKECNLGKKDKILNET